MNTKKPEPIIQGRNLGLCPVCGKTSYSLAGVHPQCAVRQMDAKRLKKRKRGRPAVKQSPAAAGGQRWQKLCPKCRQWQHVRKKVCSCGHVFNAHAPVSNSSGKTS